MTSYDYDIEKENKKAVSIDPVERLITPTKQEIANADFIINSELDVFTENDLEKVFKIDNDNDNENLQEKAFCEKLKRGISVEAIIIFSFLSLIIWFILLFTFDYLFGFLGSDEIVRTFALFAPVILGIIFVIRKLKITHQLDRAKIKWSDKSSDNLKKILPIFSVLINNSLSEKTKDEKRKIINGIIENFQNGDDYLIKKKYYALYFELFEKRYDMNKIAENEKNEQNLNSIRYDFENKLKAFSNLPKDYIEFEQNKIFSNFVDNKVEVYEPLTIIPSGSPVGDIFEYLTEPNQNLKSISNKLLKMEKDELISLTKARNGELNKFKVFFNLLGVIVFIAAYVLPLYFFKNFDSMVVATVFMVSTLALIVFSNLSEKIKIKKSYLMRNINRDFKDENDKVSIEKIFQSLLFFSLILNSDTFSKGLTKEERVELLKKFSLELINPNSNNYETVKLYYKTLENSEKIEKRLKDELDVERIKREIANSVEDCVSELHKKEILK